MTYSTKILAPLLLGVTFIYPNAGGWTTITPGGANGGIHQYMVAPGPGQIAPNGARMAPTYNTFQREQQQRYQQTVPSYQPSLPGYEDDDDGE